MGRFTGRKIDYSSMSTFPNVDTMFDVLISTQKELGVEPFISEATYDEKTGNKIRRMKRDLSGRLIDTKTGNIIDPHRVRAIPIVKQVWSNDSYSAFNTQRLNYKHSDSNNSSDNYRGEVKPNKEKQVKGLFENGFDNFYHGISGEDVDDDNDEYLCEYCTDLGYSGKYKSYICDNCTKCETCSEFLRGSCDGCTYSRTRTGSFYSDTLEADQIIDSDDLQILEESVKSDCTRRPYKGFSTLKY